jgi:N4-gp56 family major capsid protein
MASTEFELGNALAVQRWSASLAIEAEKKMYFRKFMGTSTDSMIVIKTELAKQAGDKIVYALRMKLAGDGIEGDSIIEGTSAEEALQFYSDSLYIDQRRKSTKSKGKMSEQRVPYNLRKEGRDALATWFAEDYDEQCFMYLSGNRGEDTGFHVPVSFTGRANNTLTAPNTANIIYGGDAAGPATMDSSDKMDLSIIERLVAKAETQDPMIQPFKIDGELKHVLLMHTFQAYDLRSAVSTNDWVDIQKTAGNRGDSNLLFQNALGEYAGVILHKHRNIIRFNDYGTGWSSYTSSSGTLTAARALFLGSQAGMIGWGGGSSEGRYSWNEEMDDRGNALAITVAAIYGVKKTRFNSKDFGIVAVDTYYDDPNS